MPMCVSVQSKPIACMCIENFVYLSSTTEHLLFTTFSIPVSIWEMVIVVHPTNPWLYDLFVRAVRVHSLRHIFFVATMGLVFPCQNRMPLTHTKLGGVFFRSTCVCVCDFFTFSHFQFIVLYCFQFSNQLEWHHPCNSSIVLCALAFLHTCTKTCNLHERFDRRKKSTHSISMWVLSENLDDITRRAEIPPMT